jgi:hypothetical protein
MTEAEAFELLRAYLVKLDTEAVLLYPNWPKLTNVIKSPTNGPSPIGPYVGIQLISDRDAEDALQDEYDDIDIDGVKRAVLSRTRGWEWLFRVKLFSSNQTDNLKLFSTALETPHSEVELFPLNVRLVGRITTAPKLSADEWEGQSYIDVTVAGLTTEKMIVDVIEKGRVTIIDETSKQTRQVNFQKPEE